MNTIYKRLLACLILGCCYLSTYAQDCPYPNALDQLDVNNVRAIIKNGGDLWWDGNDAGYIVPKVDVGQPEVAAIFAGGLWLAGLDAGGNFRMAAPTYGAASGATDYFAGPLEDDGTTTNDDCDNYDLIWSTNSADINSHMADLADNGVIDGPIPGSLLAWPGRMNPHFEGILGFPLINTLGPLAPFVDQNMDGIYNPEDGDYPNIKNADSGKWSIFNDAGGLHTATNTSPLNVEVHLLSYAYISADDAINNTTFYDYTIIHKGTEVIDSVFSAIWVDPDLGCYTDDYVGCFPESNLGFIYNADATDGDNGCTCLGGAVNTYCDEIPVLGVKILDGINAGRIFLPGGELGVPPPGVSPDTIISVGMSSFIHYNNGGSTPAPPPATTDPGSPIEYYNYMNGHWRDGLPLTEGGNGYDPISTEYTKYAFSGNPSDVSDWSMCSEGLIEGDRRFVLGSGPFRMAPGSVNRISMAVIFQENVAHPCPDLSSFQDMAEEVQEFWESSPMTSLPSPIYNEASLNLTPNPFTNLTQLSLNDDVHSLHQVQLFSISGQLLRSYNNLSSSSLTIEKEALTPGMYIYKAVSSDQKVFTGKLVVQ